jgi:RNA polymerase sigma-70 factor (ECF subfamily)
VPLVASMSEQGDRPEEPSGTSRPDGPSDIVPDVYDALKRIAARYVRRERDGTPNPSDIVHEAYLKLAKGRPREYADRLHFTAIAARAMRQVLVDRARARQSAKRGGDPLRVRLSDDLVVVGPGEDVLALHRALERLEAEDAPAAQVVVYRFFGGLTEVEIGALMSRSERWVRDQWTFARAWLRRELAGGQYGSGSG